jgi:hypothetical protein
MAIMREYKVFFIHIPRTGGHTIDALFGHRRNKQKDRVKRHAYPKDYKNIFPKEWKEYFKFTFVRNPWDRVVSAWTRSRGSRNYLVEDKKNIHDDKWFSQNIRNSFNAFIENELNNVLVSGHFIPQSKWLLKSNKKPYKYNFIGRFEYFERDLGILLDNLDIDYSQIPVMNVSNKRPYIEYYNNKTLKIVKELYKEEIEYLGYEYGE